LASSQALSSFSRFTVGQFSGPFPPFSRFTVGQFLLSQRGFCPKNGKGGREEGYPPYH